MTHRMKLSVIGLALGAAGVLAAAAPAWSASGDAQYREDVARCKSGASGQNMEACMREAGASLVERRRNGLTTPADPQSNAAARCDRLPPDQRQACIIQMSGQGNTRVQGSVSEGGIVRETIIQVPAGTPGSTTFAPGGSVAPAGGTPSGTPLAPPPVAPSPGTVPR